MQSRTFQSDAIAITESETYQTLLARAQRRTGGVPAERIVRHVLSVTQGGDWPVQRDALDAVLRRCASAHTDEIQIVATATGPAVGSVRDPPPRVARTPVPHAAPSDRAARWQLRVRRFPPELARAVQAPRRRPRGRGLEAASRGCRARGGLGAGTVALGSGPPADRPWRLAGARSLGRRHARPRFAALAASNERTWLDRRDSRSAAAAADVRGSIAWRARRRRQRAGTARVAAARARAARAPDPDREHPEAPAPRAAHPQAIALSLST